MADKRSSFLIILDTKSTFLEEKYALIGDGVTELSIEYKPIVKTQKFIDRDSSQTEIYGYTVKAPIKMLAKCGDSIFDFVNDIRRERKSFSDCVTVCYLIEQSDMTKTVDGFYPTEKQKVVIGIDSFGGSADDPLEIKYSLYFSGNSILGEFNPETKTFRVVPV